MLLMTTCPVLTHQTSDKKWTLLRPFAGSQLEVPATTWALNTKHIVMLLCNLMNSGLSQVAEHYRVLRGSFEMQSEEIKHRGTTFKVRTGPVHGKLDTCSPAGSLQPQVRGPLTMPGNFLLFVFKPWKCLLLRKQAPLTICHTQSLAASQQRRKEEHSRVCKPPPAGGLGTVPSMACDVPPQSPGGLPSPCHPGSERNGCWVSRRVGEKGEGLTSHALET